MIATAASPYLLSPPPASSRQFHTNKRQQMIGYLPGGGVSAVDSHLRGNDDWESTGKRLERDQCRADPVWFDFIYLQEANAHQTFIPEINAAPESCFDWRRS
jgi:hypothetical protein